MAETPQSKAISIKRLAMTFESTEGEKVEALHPVDLEISAGQFVALVGPSGCGKSTILNILAGFLAPTQGQVLVGGELIRKPSIDRGMVFQDYALFPWLNIIDNVAFGLERMGVGKKERKEIAADYLATVGLQDFERKRPSELSGGMKQRAAIARVFATDPSIILMDEPFGALDALTRRFLQHQLLEIWQKHKKTIIFVTHSVQEAVYLANRVLVMTARPGQIKLDNPIDLPYPREFTTKGFRDHEKLIYDVLDEELAKTFDLESKGHFLD